MPFQRSPCSICKRGLIEHYDDPQDVLCVSCDYLVNRKREEIAREKQARLKPPQTFKIRPTPPPMRTVRNPGPADGLGFYLGVVVFSVAVGIAMGWKMAGGL